MQDGRTDIERLRQQVIRDLADLPTRPWTRRPLSQRQRVVLAATTAWHRVLDSIHRHHGSPLP